MNFSNHQYLHCLHSYSTKYKKGSLRGFCKLTIFLELPRFRKVVVHPLFLALQLPSIHRIDGFVLENQQNISDLGYDVFTRCYGCRKKKSHLFPPTPYLQ